jgi:hypothetical protein
MLRSILITVLGGTVLNICFAAGVHDPAFREIPYKQWLNAGDTAKLKWKARASTPQLEPNQRLLGQLELEFDGVDLEPRRGQGSLRVFVEIEDQAGTIYQDHGDIDLKPIQEGFRKFNLTYVQQIFFTPGNYRFSVLVVHDKTQDHWARRFTLSVPQFKPDALPGIWNDLPTVELIPGLQPPESYWIPTLKGRLRPILPSSAREIDLLLNLSASPHQAGNLQVQQQNLGMLVPAMRAITELLGPAAKINVDLLDLVRRRVVLRQNAGTPLEFSPKLRDALTVEPGKIDVRSLAHRDEQASYFVNQVAKHLEPDRVVIILSALVELDREEARTRIEAKLPPGARVFCFCYAPPVRMPRPIYRLPQRRDVPPPRVPVDALAGTLKPLDPVVYTFGTSHQLRRALADMLDEIARPRK